MKSPMTPPHRASMPPRILFVEDEPGFRRTVRDRLRSEGFFVEVAADGNAALAALALTGADHDRRRQGSDIDTANDTVIDFDLILLDIMLPGHSGLEVCRRIRERDPSVGIIMLTALGQTADTVSGLGLGADDYITKPVEFAELLARIQALLRRAEHRRPSAGPGEPAVMSGFSVAGVDVDVRRAEVTRNGEPLKLSATEFHLLRYLYQQRGAAVTREELLAEVWGYDGQVSTRTVDTNMANLRRKIEPNPRRPLHLLTVHGIGYKLV